MKFIYPVSVVFTALLVMAGCATAPDDKRNTVSSGSLPEWVANPTTTDGLASTECVPWSGNFSLDRAEAVAKARADLVKKIEINVKAMDKVSDTKAYITKGISSGGVFERVSKQVTERHLNGTQVSKVDMLEISKGQHLCAMVILGGSESRKLFDDIIGSSSVAHQINPQDERVLWQEFRAQKLQQELEDETR